MNIEHFIAKRIAFTNSTSFTKVIIRIAMAAIAVSLTVMILTTAIISGFKKERKMTPSIIRDQLDSALGMTLAAADARTYKIDGGMAAHPDIGEVVLSFAPSTKHYLSWEQRGEWHELSLRGSSHLLPDSFGGGTPEMEGVLSEAMGKPFPH